MQWGCLYLQYSGWAFSGMLLGRNRISGSEGSLASTSTYPCFGYSGGGAFGPQPGAPNLLCHPSLVIRTGRENLKENVVGTRAGHYLIPSGAQEINFGEIIANETEQGNEELLCLNRSLTEPFSHLSLLPLLNPAPDFSASFISSLTFVSTWLSVRDCYSFLLAAAVQQFPPLSKIQFFGSCSCCC